MTNGDYIRGMTDEKLMFWINNKMSCEMCSLYQTNGCSAFSGNDDCEGGILEWLKQERSEE